MTDSISDILSKKADELDLGAKKSDLQIIQLELDRLFGPANTAASQVQDDGCLLVKAKSPAIATKVFYAQVQIIQALDKQTKRAVVRVRTFSEV